MRKTAAPGWLGALTAGLVLVAGLAVTGAAHAQSASRAWLGVYTQDLTPELRDGMDYQGKGGVLVNRVVPDSPAGRAGVSKGDVLLSFDGRSIDTAAGLQEAVRAAKVGQSVTLVVFRDGAKKTLLARLAARPTESEMERMAPMPPEAPEAPEAPGGPDDRRIIVREIHPGDLPDMEGMPGMDMMGGGMGRGRLGVRIETLTPDLGAYFGRPEGKGALVLEVLDGTPAEKAGLKPGDVIVKVEDQDVDDAAGLVKALADKEGAVNLRVVRHGGTRTFAPVLEKATEPRAMHGYGDTPAGPGRNREIHVYRYGGPSGMGPKDTEKRVRVYVHEKDGPGSTEDLRRELDDLREQLDDLQRRLDEKGR